MNVPTRPVLRWHGGKWLLAPWIISHFPPHRVYVEPFGGGGSVLLRKPRAYAEVWNDLDGEAVNLFQVLRDEAQAQRLVRLLELTPFAREEFETTYQTPEEPVERARALLVRAFMGFGSNGHNRVTGFRANSNRSGTTPAHDWANYPGCLHAAIERLRGVVIENRSAFDLMPQHDRSATLFYVDPPYVMETRADTSKDYAHELTDDDHVRLLDLLEGLTGMVILSGYPSGLYDTRLKHWQRIEREARADGAAKRTEVLWLNPACADALSKGRLL